MNRRDIFMAAAGLAVAPLAIAKSDEMPRGLKPYVNDMTYSIYDREEKEWTILERQCWDGDTFRWKPVHPLNLKEGELVLARDAKIVHKITRAPFVDEKGFHCIVADTWEY